MKQTSRWRKNNSGVALCTHVQLKELVSLHLSVSYLPHYKPVRLCLENLDQALRMLTGLQMLSQLNLTTAPSSAAIISKLSHVIMENG